jgi:hypothetical protein
LLKIVDSEAERHIAQTPLGTDYQGCTLAAGRQTERSDRRAEITERLEKAGEFIPQYLRGWHLPAKEIERPPVNSTRSSITAAKHRSAIYPLAQLGKARATKDKAEYEKFSRFGRMPTRYARPYRRREADEL